MTHAAMNMGVHLSFQNLALHSLGYIPKSGISGSYDNSILIVFVFVFLETAVLFSIAATAFCFLNNRAQVPITLHSCQH